MKHRAQRSWARRCEDASPRLGDGLANVVFRSAVSAFADRVQFLGPHLAGTREHETHGNEGDVEIPVAADNSLY